MLKVTPKLKKIEPGLQSLRFTGAFPTLILFGSVTFAQLATGQDGSPVALRSADAGQPLQFEVATIKEFDSRHEHTMGVTILPGGMVQISDANLKSLIAMAYHVAYWQITGGETWMEKNDYDVTAKPPDGMMTSQTSPQHMTWSIDHDRLCRMLQSLLAERFQLKFHHESRSGAVYILERSGRRIKLVPRNATPTIEKSSGLPPGHGEVSFVDYKWFLENVSMAQLAEEAGNHIFHRPVLDHTGLAGSFDYQSTTPMTLEARQDAPSPRVDLEDAFRALLSEVGLKIISAKGRIDEINIDHAEFPSPN